MTSSKQMNAATSAGDTSLSFVLDSNLGLPIDEQPWSDILEKANIETMATDDMDRVDKMLLAHEPDIAFIPAGDFHRLGVDGDRHYRGLAIATSKFSGQPRLKSLLVVRKDDPATSLDDLEGAKLSYINCSCSSSYFPPGILLQRKGKQLRDFFEIVQIKPGRLWQGPLKAVVDGQARATMILEDMWRSVPENAETTKVIGEYVGGTPAVIVVRHDLDEGIKKTMLDACLEWTPPWKDKIFGAFRPYYYADVHTFFHDLDQLPKDF